MIEAKNIKEIILGTDGNFYLILFGNGNGVRQVVCYETSDSRIAYGAEIKNTEEGVALSDKHGKEVIVIPVQTIFRAESNVTVF